MNKHFVASLVLVFFVCVVPAFAVETPSTTYSETLPQSAFQLGDAEAAVKMLLDSGVPISVIINAAIQNGVSPEALVGALLGAGISAEKVVLYCLEGPMPFEKVLYALKAHGVLPEDVLTWLIKRRMSSSAIYDVCDFMLKQGYSKADLLRVLKDADADRKLVIQVVRWFDIPPATVVAVYQSLGRRAAVFFGLFFTRHSLPQPALLAIGVARINVDECGSRPVISPMKP